MRSRVSRVTAHPVFATWVFILAAGVSPCVTACSRRHLKSPPRVSVHRADASRDALAWQMRTSDAQDPPGPADDAMVGTEPDALADVTTAAMDDPQPSLAGEDPCGRTSRLQVMTFNLRYDPGEPTRPDDLDAWRATMNPRRDRVVRTLTAADADLIGVQEPLAHQVDDLNAALPDYEFFGVGRDDGRRNGEFVGIFFRRRRLTRLEGGHFWLSETPEVPGTVFEGSAWIRMVTWLRLRDTATQRTFLALNTHWDDVSASARERSARLIRARLTTLAGNEPVIMTADLNSTSATRPVAILLGAPNSAGPLLLDGYRQVVALATPDERTYHAFGGSTQGSRIDFILHSHHFHTLATTIVHTSFDGRYPSDHFPVVATLGWTRGLRGQRCP